MLTAKMLRSYVTENKHGQKTDMFVYLVNGTAEELALFEQAQGEYYRTNKDEDGNEVPVFISPRFGGKQANLVVLEATADKPARVVFDSSATAMARSLMEQYKGTAIESAIAQQIAATLLGTNVPTTQG
jgi:hypothetical protein